MTYTFSSRSISSDIALLMASRTVIIDESGPGGAATSTFVGARDVRKGFCKQCHRCVKRE
eukprot:885767-Pyramimonas_sp.AAC.1